MLSRTARTTSLRSACPLIVNARRYARTGAAATDAAEGMRWHEMKPHIRDPSMSKPVKEHSARKNQARIVIADQQLADELVEAWRIRDRPNVKVIELSAGSGYVTEALLKLPNVERVLALEPRAKKIKDCKLHSLASSDKRLMVREDLDHFFIDVWQDIVDIVWSDVKPMPWDAGESDVIVINHVARNPTASRFVPFCAALSPVRSIFYQWGRVPLFTTCADTYARKLTAPPGAVGPWGRMSVTVMVENAFECQRVEGVDFVTNADKRNASSLGGIGRLSALLRKDPQCSVIFTPRERPIIEVDKLAYFRYISKQLFLRQSQPWESALNTLGHGGRNAIVPRLEAMGAHIPPGVPIYSLEGKHLAAITRAFLEWPFHPDPYLSNLVPEEIKRNYDREDVTD